MSLPVLKTCPFCKSPAQEADWGMCMGYSWGLFQTVSVECSNIRCDAETSITVNADIQIDAIRYERLVSDMWNELPRADEGS